MSYGVMLLLDRLKPDERAAFVLHEAFDCDYAEIGKILERAPASCRQIVHRARARLQRAGAPLQRRDPEAHARIVERLRNALQAQDRASLLELFSDAPEVVTDQPVCRAASAVAHSAAIAPTEAATHAHRVPAKALAETGPTALDFAFGDWMERVTSLARQASHAELVSVDGALSIALLVEGEVVALIDVSTEGSDSGLTAAARGGARSGAATGVTTDTAAGATTHLTSDELRGPSPVYGYADGAAKIVSLRAVTSASRLEAANRQLGRAAVTEMLARIQQRSLDSIAMGRDFPVDVYA